MPIGTGLLDSDNKSKLFIRVNVEDVAVSDGHLCVTMNLLYGKVMQTPVLVRL